MNDNESVGAPSLRTLDDGGPVYPLDPRGFGPISAYEGNAFPREVYGMSLRDHIAISMLETVYTQRQANVQPFINKAFEGLGPDQMIALMESKEFLEISTNLLTATSAHCYEIADAMLKARKAVRP